MAHTLSFVMNPEDELSFFRFLERFELEVYPLRVPENWTPFPASAEAVDKLPEEAAYLAASSIHPVIVDKVKRGPDKGAWRVDEVRSPVIYYERSRTNDEGELLSGKLWAELEITPQTGRRNAAPDHFRRLYLDIETFFKKTFRRSEPQGFWIGPNAARAFKGGLVLRDAEPKGKVLRPFR
jgi:hypothetical protein